MEFPCITYIDIKVTLNQKALSSFGLNYSCPQMEFPCITYIDIKVTLNTKAFQVSGVIILVLRWNFLVSHI